MGALLSAFLELFSGERRAKILIVGLAAAGKTTVLYKLKLGPMAEESYPPTIGSNVERVAFGKLTMEVWDLGGQDQLREAWLVYFANTDAVVLVVDSANEADLDTVRVELRRLLLSDDLRGLPLLVLANKQDAPGAMPPAELSAALDLHAVKDRPWHIHPTVAIHGEGLQDAFQWVAEAVLAGGARPGGGR